MSPLNLRWFAEKFGISSDVVLRVRPIHEAIMSHNEHVVSLLIAEGADIGAPLVYGLTPLHLAALSVQKRELVDLLKAGANVHIPDQIG